MAKVRQTVRTVTVRTRTRKIGVNSGTEFSSLINGMKAYDVWTVIDELMDVLQATQPRLYNGVLNQIREL